MSSETKAAISLAELSDEAWIQGSKFDVVNEGTYVVQMWATWCPPCRAEIPKINKLTEIYDSVKFVGLSSEKPEAITKVKLCGMQYPCIADPNRQVYDKYGKAFGVKGIPHAFIIHNGEVKFSGHPAESEFLETLNQLTGKNVSPYDFMDPVPPMAESVKMLNGEKPDLNADTYNILTFCASGSQLFEPVVTGFINELAPKLVEHASFSVFFTDSEATADNAAAAAATVNVATGSDKDSVWLKQILETDKEVNVDVGVIVRRGKVVQVYPLVKIQQGVFGQLVQDLGEEALIKLLRDE